MVVAVSAGNCRTLVIFDLCDTLYDTNTTVGFLRYFKQSTANRRVGRRLNRWLSRSSPLFYVGAMAHRLLGIDLARNRLIASLAGESRRRLECAAQDYARHILPRLANAVVHDRLKAHCSAGDRVVLVSTSLDLIVAPVAKMLGVEFEASTLAFSKDRCAGKLDRDLTGNKGKVVRPLLSQQPTSLKVYTDNRSDLDLLAMADSATIVLPRGARNDRWAGADCEYVEL